MARKLGEGFTREPIGARCASNRGALVAVSVVRTDQESAGTATSYTVHFQGGSLVVPFGVALCPSKCTEAELSRAGY
jgi:hypothetical protein